MTEEEYQKLLKKAPKNHFSQQFENWLIENNHTVEGVDEGVWLVIRNKKYWTKENDWLTAFYMGLRWNKNLHPISAMDNLYLLSKKYGNREWLIKAPHKRTVGLFHVHLIKKQ